MWQSFNLIFQFKKTKQNSERKFSVVLPQIVEASCFALRQILCANDTPVNSRPNKLQINFRLSNF